VTRLFVLISLFAWSAMVSAQQVPNGGFEEPSRTDAQRPAAWTPSFPQGSRHIWETEVRHSGARSIRVDGLQSEKMDSHVSAWRCDVPAPPPGT